MVEGMEEGLEQKAAALETSWDEPLDEIESLHREVEALEGSMRRATVIAQVLLDRNRELTAEVERAGKEDGQRDENT